MLGGVKLGVHPNVVRAFFLDILDNMLYMTMEYIEGDQGDGPSLSEKTFQRRRIDEYKIATWFSQIADGLEHIYSSGIVAHRDIKPANILIARNGTAKITPRSDFGLLVPFPNLNPAIL